MYQAMRSRGALGAKPTSRIHIQTSTLAGMGGSAAAVVRSFAYATDGLGAEVIEAPAGGVALLSKAELATVTTACYRNAARVA